MSRSLRNVILTLTFVILLPISIFIVMEIGSLNENEEMLEEVYREQLDAIIFSVNQYAADVFDFYLKQLDFQWQQTGQQSLIDSTFLQQNLAIQAIGIKVDGSSRLFQIDSSSIIRRDYLDSIFDSNEVIIDRLIRYKEADYIKPELIGQFQIDGSISNITLVILGSSTPSLVFVDPNLFVQDLLAPKIQQIAGEELQITIEYTPTNTLVFGKPMDPSGIIQSGALTLLDNFFVQVSLMDTSLDEVISYRTQRNVILLVSMIVLILAGSILVFINLRKEMMLSRAKSDFVANVSHEIRTPLALISMFNETLMLGRVKDEKRKQEYFDIMHKETSRLSNIVNKILTFSQIDADKKSYHFEKINAHDVIEETISSYSFHLKEKGFQYSIDLKGEPWIQADKEAFIEILVNLLDNAIKYSAATKELLVRSYQSQNHLIIEVSDKGLGISRQDQRHIFEKFYRVSTGDIHNTKGTGLGLALVHEIMLAHHGSVELESELGKGSTFKLKFPS